MMFVRSPRKFVRAIAMALEVDETAPPARVDMSFWNLRIIDYEVTKENTDTSKVFGIGEHTSRPCCHSLTLELA